MGVLFLFVCGTFLRLQFYFLSTVARVTHTTINLFTKGSYPTRILLLPILFFFESCLKSLSH